MRTTPKHIPQVNADPRAKELPQYSLRQIFVNGLLFALYHLHQPWSMPAAFIDGTLNQAYPTRRFQSTWMGLISHTAPSFLVVGVVASMLF